MTKTPPPLPAHPTPDSPPSSVRAYLASILHTLHSVPSDEAHEIASHWKYGRGSELLYYYDVQTFRDMFGSEAGVLLYGYARGELLSELKEKRNDGARAAAEAVEENNNKKKKSTGSRKEKDLFGLPPGLFFVYFFFISMIVAGWLAYTGWAVGSDNRAALLSVLSTGFFVGFVMSYLAYYI